MCMHSASQTNPVWTVISFSIDSSAMLSNKILAVIGANKNNVSNLVTIVTYHNKQIVQKRRKYLGFFQLCEPVCNKMRILQNVKLSSLGIAIITTI